MLNAIAESVESIAVQVRELAGVENIEEVFEAIEILRELADDDEEILDSESLYSWLTEIARLHFEHNPEGQDPTDEAEDSAASNTDTPADPPYEEGDDELLDGWLEDIFVQELAAKIQGRDFVGGADEVDEVGGPAPCPYCNKPVGDETDQHVLRCKYAHEEQERLDWMMRRGEELRVRKGY